MSVTEQINTDSVLLSVNSLTKRGNTEHTLCIYFPLKTEEAIKEWLNENDRYPSLSVDKGCDLIGMYINHLSSLEASWLLSKLKKHLLKSKIPFLYYKGRNKNEDNNTASPQGNPWGLPSCGVLGTPKSWYLNPNKLEAMQEIVKTIHREGNKKTLGEIAEERLVKALRTIAPKWVKITQAVTGSILDIKGYDVIVSVRNEHWAMQIKSAAVEAVLHKKRYPHSAVVWVDVAEEKGMKEIAEIIASVTWKSKTKEKAA